VGRLFGNHFAIRAILETARRFEDLSLDGPWGIALGLALVGDGDRMYEYLERAEPKDLGHILSEPVFDPYGGEERFQRLLKDAGYHRDALSEFPPRAPPQPRAAKGYPTPRSGTVGFPFGG